MFSWSLSHLNCCICNTLPFSYIMFKSLNNFLIFLSKIWLILVKNIRHIETVKKFKITNEKSSLKFKLVVLENLFRRILTLFIMLCIENTLESFFPRCFLEEQNFVNKFSKKSARVNMCTCDFRLGRTKIQNRR